MSTPLSLEVGSTYRNRAGELVRITDESETAGWPFEDIAGLTYRHDGRYWDACTNDMRDLIALVSPADAAEPAPQPAPPAAPLSLEVGATYRTCAGALVRITHTDDHPNWPFEADNGHSYTPGGYLLREDRPLPLDLVERVSPANAEEANDADEVAAEADTWITDRLPTAEDADCHGDIELRDYPVFGPWPYHPRVCVVTGEVWRRTQWHPSRSNTAAPTPSTPPTPAPLTAPLTTPLNPFASIRRTVLADGTHILDAIDTAGNAWHRTISTAADWPWQLTTPLPKLRD